MYTDYTDEAENNESYYSDEGDNKNFDKSKITKIAICVIVFVVALILVVVLARSCSNAKKEGSGTASGNEPTSIIINMESLTVGVGEEKTIQASVIANENAVINWISEDSSIATVNDLGNGKVNVIGVKEGTVNVLATYRASDGKTYTSRCFVTVTSSTKKITAIKFAQDNVTLAKGKTVLLQVSVTPKDASVDNLRYSSDNTSVATVDNKGNVKAVGIGNTTITVKTSDGSLSDTIIVTVTETGSTVINPTSLVIRGLQNGISVGKTSKIIYEIYPDNATNKKVTWTSSNPKIATVDSNGVVTGVAAGKCTIVGSTSNNVSDKLEITVESNVVKVSSIKINDGSQINMSVNGTKLLSYTISPSNATNKEVVFTTSDQSVVFVNQLGILAAKKAGTATITVTTRDGNKAASIRVTVTGSSGTQTSSGSSGTGGTSSGSSSGTGGSSGSSDIGCTDQLMTAITHNGSSNGAIISSIGFNQAKPFSNMTTIPTITFTDITSCIGSNSVNYKIYYGTSSSNISSTAIASGQVKKNSKLQLTKGNGYYQIKLSSKIYNSQASLNKTYYAIIKDTLEKTAPIIISIVATRASSSSLKIDYNVNEQDSGLKQVQYCLTSSTSCTANKNLVTFSPVQKSKNIKKSKTITDNYLPAYKRVCLVAIDDAGNKSSSLCTAIK